MQRSTRSTARSGALCLARDWHFIAHDPIVGVVPPPPGKPRVAYWMPEHVTRFLNAVEARPWYPLYVVACYTGARLGA